MFPPRIEDVKHELGSDKHVRVLTVEQERFKAQKQEYCATLGLYCKTTCTNTVCEWHPKFYDGIPMIQ